MAVVGQTGGCGKGEVACLRVSLCNGILHAGGRIAQRDAGGVGTRVDGSSGKRSLTFFIDNAHIAALPARLGQRCCLFAAVIGWTGGSHDGHAAASVCTVCSCCHRAVFARCGDGVICCSRCAQRICPSMLVCGEIQIVVLILGDFIALVAHVRREDIFVNAQIPRCAGGDFNRVTFGGLVGHADARSASQAIADGDGTIDLQADVVRGAAGVDAVAL